MEIDIDQLAGIDVDAVIRPLLPNYIRRRTVDIELIDAFLSAGDFSEIRRLAHNMRGSGTAYGFPMITELGGRMEEAAVAFDRNTIQESNRQLEKLVARLYL